MLSDTDKLELRRLVEESPPEVLYFRLLEFIARITERHTHVVWPARH
ncbi:MAG: hypothetical protein ACJ8C4_16535 [Gemmataceae bacterium]